ncbi:hypothetical protein K438DRAFT_1799684 [Mycena galopus ATCC 62051]|nr:hypothetical protein K438DRAFT_1799684 [Mycena galopus ATCC 62051]
MSRRHIISAHHHRILLVVRRLAHSERHFHNRAFYVLVVDAYDGGFLVLHIFPKYR